jgi:hypothetical protein
MIKTEYDTIARLTSAQVVRDLRRWVTSLAHCLSVPLMRTLWIFREAIREECLRCPYKNLDIPERGQTVRDLLAFQQDTRYQ